MYVLIVALPSAPTDTREQLTQSGVTNPSLMNDRPSYLVDANWELLDRILRLPRVKSHIIMTPMPEHIKSGLSFVGE